jgi:hypothetical protein
MVYFSPFLVSCSKKNLATLLHLSNYFDGAEADCGEGRLLWQRSFYDDFQQFSKYFLSSSAPSEIWGSLFILEDTKINRRFQCIAKHFQK